jgi:hypothetical protein
MNTREVNAEGYEKASAINFAEGLAGADKKITFPSPLL